MMEVSEVIALLAVSGIVEEIVSNVAKGWDDDLADLSQDLYLDLMEKGDKVVEMFGDGSIRYFISRMAVNNIKSVKSPYYMKYGRWKKLRSNNDIDLDGYEG